MIKFHEKIEFVFITLFIFINLNSAAQPVSKIQKKFDKALRFYQRQEFGKSISEAQKLVEKNPGFVNGWLLMADIYHDLDSAKQEISVLENALKYTDNPTVCYRIGEAFYKGGRYKLALPQFEKYLETNNPTGKRKPELLHKINNCRFAIKALSHPVDFHPEPLPRAINTPDDEYWPTLSLDSKQLVFTRLIETAGRLPQEDFFISEFDSSGWGRATPIVEINTPENEGAQAISTDGRLFFFTACNRPGGMGSCDIYFSKFDNGKWSHPRNAGAPLNSSRWEAQPSFSSDNRFLYFSSNRSGGKGGKDIWRAELIGFGKTGLPVWKKPENLGDSINTPANEISPFIHFNNKDFYFVSNGLTGMGGLDLFTSVQKPDGSFSTPDNLGYPINTCNDEQGFTISSDGRKAFFASERNAAYGLDIYSVKLPEKLRPDAVTFVKAKVVDITTKKPIKANIQLVDLYNNGKNPSNAKADFKGEALLCLPLGTVYSFTVSEPGYLFFSQSLQLSDSKKIHNPYLFNIELQPLKIGAEMNLYNIYFDTDSFSILPASIPELRKLTDFLSVNSDLTVEIQGHTDNTGDRVKNQKLSELRALSVVKYLTEQSIEAQRLQPVGFGDTRPVADNETPEGRQLNRRTTIKIVRKK
ncbi:MAG: PD40 domain-containing protein [Prolixibacteraceae bacterium]|nr:PD40 domain-containing protein [Prolixibacteraceae bacterium]